MNKKKLLFIALALVLVMTVLMPSTAFAKNNQYQHEPAYTDFTGYGFVYLGNFPAIKQKGNTIWFHKEIVLGSLDEEQCTWEELKGADFWSIHDSVVTVAYDGSAQGTMQGKFKLETDKGALLGTFQGSITCMITWDSDGNMLIDNVSDTGTWKCTGGTGVFKGVEAWGEWSALLIMNLDLGTLAGSLNWSGKYSNPEKWDGEKPGKPEKPWKSDDVKPGKPIKDWKNSD